MEIVEAFQASISDNAMQHKRGQENPRKSSSDSEKSAWKDLEKGFHGLDGFGAGISAAAALPLEGTLFDKVEVMINRHPCECDKAVEPTV
jgi:hypothetical protein